MGERANQIAAINKYSTYAMYDKTILRNLLFIFAKRFIAGQTFSEALPTILSLHSRGFKTTVDHLGEEVKDAKTANLSADGYIALLKELKRRTLNVNISVKLTQLGLAVDKNLCLENLKKIARCAQDSQGFVRVDMEGSQYTIATLDIVKALKDEGLPVGVVVQAMLRRTPMDVVSLLEKGVSIRLCKGAYKEPVDLAYQKKDEINRQFISLMKRLLTSNYYHGIATHDKKIIAETKSFIQAKDHRPNGKDKCEFQMLLGINQRLQSELVREGFSVRIYVPFGKAWLPYIYRRLRERKENVFFVLKHLFIK